jgi:hypothetical protein
MFDRTGIGVPICRSVLADLTTVVGKPPTSLEGPDVVLECKKTRLCFIYAPGRSVHGVFMSVSRILASMGDFMAVIGIIAFALVMLGLIWGLEHV